MDLILVVLVYALIGCVIWLITTKLPMPPYWATVIQVGALIFLMLDFLRRLGIALPNVLR